MMIWELTERKRKKFIKRAQALLAFIIVVYLVSVSVSSGETIEEFGKDAVRKAEVAQIAKAVAYYEIDHGYYPKNPSRHVHCAIDEYYGKQKCLGELVRDGYFESLPFSSDRDYPYVYIVNGREVSVGVIVDNAPEQDFNDCSTNSGVYIWCMQVRPM